MRKIQMKMEYSTDLLAQFQHISDKSEDDDDDNATATCTRPLCVG